jgi:hypothetical protein
MEAVLKVREKIYDHIQNGAVCHWMDRATHDQYVTYCVSKDTIQDTAETLYTHRQRGFTENMYAKYFEYYGILQAVYLQQDAIWALHRLFLGAEPDISAKPNWKRIRDLRNDTAGHPVGRRRFLNRNAIGYERVNYSWWLEGDRYPKSEDVPLASLLDGYANEATAILTDVHAELERSCATKHT